MILSNNAFNWAMLRSGMGTGDFIASLTPEREEELFKQYNEWRRKRGLKGEPSKARQKRYASFHAGKGLNEKLCETGKE